MALAGAVSSLPYLNNLTGPAVAPPPSASAMPSPVPTTTPPVQYPDLSNFKVGGADTFKQGLATSAPSTTIDPATQQVLDIINKNRNYAATSGASQASALASRRGLAGSSIEQFGVQSANEAADRAAQDSTASVLNQFTSQQAALKQLQAQGLFQRAGQEGTLTSDELASLRNMDFANKSLGIQTQLGQEGLDIQRANVNQAGDIAANQQRNSLIQTGASLLAPYALPALFGSSGGIGSSGGLFSGLFGGGAGASSILSGAGAANPGAASSLFPAGLGGVGTGVTGTGVGVGSAGGAMAALGPAALAVGGVLGYQSLSNGAKAVVAPLVNPVNTVKQVASKVTSAVSSVFRF